MTIFGLTVETISTSIKTLESAVFFGKSIGYESALIDAGYTSYEEEIPDEEYTCHFAGYGRKAWYGESINFPPEFDVAGLYWKECK